MDATAQQQPSVAEQFQQMGEWITRFPIGGEWHGGSYVAQGDDRLRKFVTRMDQLPAPPRSILECGCLEGGHTIQLAAAFPAATIYAVDIRDDSLAKAKLVCGLTGCTNVHFARDDFDAPAEIFNRGYDAIFCVGLLYHLRWPDKFLQSACAAAPVLWLWTVYCDERDVSIREGQFRGRMYEEPTAHPLSAVRDQSFFPALGSLNAMLWDAGYTSIELVRREMTANGSGPAVLLCATR